MSNTNGYLPRSLLDELDKKEKKPTAPVKAAQKNSKETYNATSTEAVTAKKNAVERAVADSLTVSTAPKATKSDNHDVYHQVKETSATTADTNNTTTARRESTVTHTGSGRSMDSSSTSPTRTADREKRYDDDGTVAKITKENVLDYYDRARVLADMPSWSSTERKEAEAITKALERADTQRTIQKTSDKINEWNLIASTLYNKTHPISSGFTANLVKASGAVSITEVLMNGLGKLTGKQELSEAGRQASREIDRIAEYGRQAAPLASGAGNALGSVALYGGLADLSASIPALAGASPVLRSAAVHGAASGGTTAMRELGKASTTDEWGGYALDVGVSAGKGAVRGAAAQVVIDAISDILRSAAISQQNKTLIQQDMDDVRQRYEETVKALADPNATPKQRALLAQSTVDNADWASRRMDELVPYGGYESRAAQDALAGIVEEMKPYTLPENGWTNNSGYGSINPSSTPQSLKLPDEVIGRSVGAKSQNYDILDLETGDHYHLAEGTRLQNIEVFAGKGTRTEYRKAEWYANKYGGEVDAWQHAKGIGTVETPDGQYSAELHWTQCEGFGRIDMFIKRWLE